MNVPWTEDSETQAINEKMVAAQLATEILCKYLELQKERSFPLLNIAPFKLQDDMDEGITLMCIYQSLFDGVLNSFANTDS